MKFSNLFKLVILLFCVSSCTTQTTENTDVSNEEINPVSNRIVQFKGRNIDLKPYVEGFPYSNFHPFYGAGKLYYTKRGQKTTMLELDLKGNPNLDKGKTISDIDYSTRNVWSIRFNKNDKNLYWVGDTKNDEIINLTKLDPNSGKVEKLTDVPYIFGYQFNEDASKVAYIARLGNKENRLGEVRILDLTTKEETKIIQDNPSMRYTWGSPSWQPNGRGLVVNALKDADRTFGNIVYIDLEKKTESLVTNKNKQRSFPGIFKEWLDNNTFIYVSNEDGFRNIYSHNISLKKTRQLTKFSTDLGSSEVITIDGKKYMFATTSSPIETQIYLLDLSTGNIVFKQKSDVAIGIYDKDGNKLMVSASSNTSMFRIDEITVSMDGLEFKTMVDIPKELKDRIYKASVERIEYPTFDIDPKTGKPRRLHAYLYKPKKPLPAKDQIVLIQSFYGGGNNFSMRYQVLADAGIYVLSPSPRGSSGFGKDFAALNDKDLGGDEIIDIFYAAKFISEQLNIPPQNIGVFGGSHGGYATMRTLTFPNNFKGKKIEFDWGFGLSHAGFSNIIDFYENCNIPDWVTLEAGDPRTEADKLNDRSPLFHADKMKGHLLLTHGTNDKRVPIAGSRMMADSLKKYNKNVKLVEFEGQGHGIKGLENTVNFYQAWFDFLEEVSGSEKKKSSI